MEEVLAEYQLQDETQSVAKRRKTGKDTKHHLSESNKDWTSTSETDTLDTSGTSHSSLNSSTVESKESEEPPTGMQQEQEAGHRKTSSLSARTHGLQSM